MKLFIGNLSYDTTESALRSAFQNYSVTSVKIVSDRETGRSRGFGFIEFSDDEQGRAAMSEMNGYELDGFQLKVNEAKPQEERSGGRSFGGGGSSRGYSNGSYGRSSQGGGRGGRQGGGQGKRW
jgi:cold-inducible RNA-binding protein